MDSYKEAFLGEEISALYEKYRPTYPDELYRLIYEFCDKIEGFEYDTVVDLACGTGKSLKPMATKFKTCIGIDASETQIEKAKETNEYENIEFRVGDCNELSYFGFSDVDLITCVSAMHGLDVDTIYKQVKELLKPNGVFAVWFGVNVSKMDYDNDDATELHRSFSEKTFDQKNRSHPGIKDIFDKCYDDMKRQFNDCICHEINMNLKFSIDSMVKFLSTYTSCRVRIQKDPNNDVLGIFKQELMAIYSRQVGHPINESYEICVTGPIKILLCRNNSV